MYTSGGTSLLIVPSAGLAVCSPVRGDAYSSWSTYQALQKIMQEDRKVNPHPP